MNILIIKAHPSSRGFTHKIASSYKRESLRRGHSVEIIDLYSKKYGQDFFCFEDIRNIPKDCKRLEIQAKIKDAHELVFIYPIWWMSVPAILKNFIDTNFTSGFAFRYKKVPIIKGMPVGLLKGKKARIFVTCDGSRWFYKLIFTPFKLHFKYFILLVFGIRTKSFVIFDRMRWMSEKKNVRMLGRVVKLAQKK